MSEWVRYADRAAWAEGVARVCAMAIERGIERRGHATAALAGGSTPAAVLPKLFTARLPWERVTLTVSDERQVDEADPLSNFGQLRRVAAGTGAEAATIVPLAPSPHPNPSPLQGEGLVSLSLQGRGTGRVSGQGEGSEPLTLDLLWAGVGEDGHALSWFPGPDLAAAYADPGPVVAVRPDPLPQAASVPRWTLTLPAARAAPNILIAATGDTKRAILENPADHPVARLLALPQTVVHWAP